MLVVGDEPGLAEEAASGEARDGVTPPMRNARERIFRKPVDVAPDVVQKVEYDLLTILAVSIGRTACVCVCGGGVSPDDARQQAASVFAREHLI